MFPDRSDEAIPVYFDTMTLSMEKQDGTTLEVLLDVAIIPTVYQNSNYFVFWQSGAIGLASTLTDDTDLLKR